MLLATGCRGRTAVPETAHDTEQSKSSSKSNQPKSEAAPAADQPLTQQRSAQQPEQRQPLQLQAESALSGKPALGVSGFRLQLPRDPAFVDAPLPAPEPERYRTWAQMARIWVGKSNLEYATFLDDERLILARSGAESGVHVYERSSRKQLAYYDLGLGSSSSVAILPWSSHGTSFLIGSELYDARTGAPISTLSVRSAGRMRWSPDGNVLMVCDTPAPDQPSVLWFYRKQSAREPHDVVQLQELGGLPIAGRVEGFDLSADNRLLAVSLYPQDAVVVFDLHTGETLTRVPAQRFTGSVSISPDGRWLAVGGQGLLLIDLANPSRRAFYSYYHNNIDSVRFSPSGDAVVTSSYDGRIRVFAYDTEGPTLRLVKTLSHDGQANVYSIEFAADGDSLLSASGDQTLRIFGSRRNTKSALRGPPGRFRSLDDWRAHLPRESLAVATPPAPSMKDGHYYPPQLDAPARPSKIRPGLYACHISEMYKLRDCTVRKTPSGHTLLEFASDNLFGLTGVLYDDGPVVRYEAWLTEHSIVVGCDGCERQPLHGVLRGGGRNFKGLLTFRNYYDPFSPPPLPPANATIEDADDRFELILNYKGPLPDAQPLRQQRWERDDPR
jgi:hypothetical protein